jgi:hypothetical protein
MELLHTYSDSSKLFRMSALSLTHIPIWKGNRIIDRSHVDNIKRSISDNIRLLDSGYKIIKYDEFDEDNNPIKKSYLIDGQHRISVLNDYFTNTTLPINDFQVTVTEIHVESEMDAIQYFNTINNVKPIHFEEDINLVVNKYIQKIIMSYPSKCKLFRNGITKRPYLSVDKLRDALKNHIHKLKLLSTEQFLEECIRMNDIIITELESLSLYEKHKELHIIKKSIELNFGLAWDNKFKWLNNVCN